MSLNQSVLICDQVNSTLKEILEKNGLKVTYEPEITHEQIAETIIVANMLYTNADSGDIDKILEKINQLKEESLTLIKKSDSLRP